MRGCWEDDDMLRRLGLVLRLCRVDSRPGKEEERASESLVRRQVPKDDTHDDDDDDARCLSVVLIR
jgi:hypothetical protein